MYWTSTFMCYLRATPSFDNAEAKFLFYDFECSQDQIVQCSEGYMANVTENCTQCSTEEKCKSCSKCKNSLQSWCGKQVCGRSHRMWRMYRRPSNPPVYLCRCGNRCHIRGHEDYKGPSCPNTCGKRETVFRGVNTLNLFGAWLFCETHKFFTAVAHNSKSYDGIVLLNYLISQSIRPDKIIYNGSKIMYLHVGRGLNIRLIDSLNCLPMKSFGLTELKKGWFHISLIRTKTNTAWGLFRIPSITVWTTWPIKNEKTL